MTLKKLWYNRIVATYLLILLLGFLLGATWHSIDQELEERREIK